MSWIVSSPVVYPILEVLHIVGIAMLLGNLLLFEMRVWGYGGELDFAALARLSLRIAVVGFGVAAVTGSLMFAGQAAELIGNRAFVLKMGFLTLAGANAGIFHARDGLARVDRTAKLQTVLSLLLWLAVLAGGRWIAYV